MSARVEEGVGGRFGQRAQLCAKGSPMLRGSGSVQQPPDNSVSHSLGPSLVIPKRKMALVEPNRLTVSARPSRNIAE